MVFPAWMISLGALIGGVIYVITHQNEFKMLLNQPKYEYTNRRTYKRTDPNDQACLICLQYFKSTEKKVKRHCRHVFHESCIKAWLYHKDTDNTCPVCEPCEQS